MTIVLDSSIFFSVPAIIISIYVLVRDWRKSNGPNREHVTMVPPDFFDDVAASLDEPPTSNDDLSAAARKNRDIIDP